MSCVIGPFGDKSILEEAFPVMFNPHPCAEEGLSRFLAVVGVSKAGGSSQALLGVCPGPFCPSGAEPGSAERAPVGRCPWMQLASYWGVKRK